MITITQDPRIDHAETTITVEMTAVIAIATTGTTIMIVTTMIGMTGMIGETHVVAIFCDCVGKRGGTTGVLNQRASEDGERERTGYAQLETHRDSALRHRKHE